MENKMEVNLSLLGSIIGMIVSLFISITPTYAYLFNRTTQHSDDHIVLIILLSIGFFVMIASIIGFIGTRKLKKGELKTSSRLLLIGGFMQILSLQGILLIIAGIKISKKV